MITDTVTPEAVETLFQLSGGAVLPRCLQVVADVGVADALEDTPQSAAALAAATGVNAEALSRTLRLLAANGVFGYRDGLFHHTTASQLLRADHPQSVRPVVRLWGLAGFWKLIAELDYSIRTGLPADSKALPGGLWGYLSGDPKASRVFDEAMTAKAYAQVPGVPSAYDFSQFKTIGDIGGGRGHLLQAVLASAPDAKGVLFDQPHVIQQASAIKSDRLSLQAGDFFKDDLPVCDAYLLMEVIHDWDDEHSRRILESVHAAAPAHAKVLIIEQMISDDSGPSWPRTLDLWMLAISGKQRTRQEYAALLAAGGFEFIREIDTRAGVSIIEGVRA
jgi:O-methyltransferase